MKTPKGWKRLPPELGILALAKEGPEDPEWSHALDVAKVDRARNPSTGLIEWRSTRWTVGGQAMVHFHGQDFYDAVEYAGADE